MALFHGRGLPLAIQAMPATRCSHGNARKDIRAPRMVVWAGVIQYAAVDTYGEEDLKRRRRKRSGTWGHDRLGRFTANDNEHRARQQRVWADIIAAASDVRFWG